jgi:PAS domain S-box-containing protein
MSMKEDWITKLVRELNLNHDQAPDDESWALFLDRLSARGSASEFDPAGPPASQSADQQLELLSESSEARYRAILEDQTEYINRCTSDGIITFVNEAYARLHNAKRADLIGKRYQDFMRETDLAYLEETRRRLTPENPFTTTDHLLTTQDGEQIWLQWRDRLIADHSGEIIGYQGVGRDITERKEMEQALRESEDHFRMLAEKSPNMIFINLDGRIVYVNEACEEIMGYSREEFYDQGFNFMDLIAPDHLPSIREKFSQHMQGVEIPPYESELITKDGRKLNAIHATRLINYAGETAILGIVTDVTNRKRSEEAQARRVAELRLLNDISQKITSVLDMDSVLTRTVQLVQESFNYPHVGIFVIDHEYGDLAMRARAGKYTDHFPTEHRLRLGEGIVGCAAKEGKALLVGDVEGDPRYINRYPDKIHSQSELAIPILVGGRLLGVLDIQSDRADAFDEHDSIVMETLVDQIAAAIEHARLYGEVQRELEERRKAEGRISLLVTALESAANAIVITDREGKIEWVNQAFTDLSGYKPEEVMNVKLSLLKSGEHTAEFYAELWETILAGSVWQGEMVNMRRDGTRYFEEQTITPVKDGKGEITHFIAIKQDITDRRISEKRIKQQAEDLKLLNELNDAMNRGASLHDILDILSESSKELFDSFGTTTYLLGDDGQHLIARNIGIPARLVQALDKITSSGIRSHRLAVKPGSILSEVLASHEPLVFNDPDECLQLVRKLIETADINSEMRSQLLEKAVQQVVNLIPLQSISLVPLLAEGHAIGLIIMGRNEPFNESDLARLKAIASSLTSAISRRIQAEALKRSETNYRSIFEGVQDAILVVGRNQRILDANSRACELYGYPRDELLQRSLVDLEEAKSASILLQEVQDSSTGEINLESMHIRSDGTTFPVEISGRTWILGDETVMLAVIRDVTEARLAQERAQLQSRLAAVGQLAAGIAHDFNNILGTILLYAELMLNNPELQEKDQERLHTIFSQAQRGANLTAQVLDFSRRSVMERHAIDLVPFLGDMQSLLARTLPETVQVKFNHGPDEPFLVQADPTRMQQVIMNLALNAKDAMPNGGSLHFSLEKVDGDTASAPFPGMGTDRWIRMTVTDTGEGIPPDIMPHIFEPFFTTKPQGQGTGLGLAQVYGIIKQHEGFIDAASTPGQGTRFDIYLPLSTTTEIDHPPAVQLANGNGTGETILVVEDDDATRAAVSEILESCGYTVLSVPDGQVALGVITAGQEQIDLVLTDLVMPKMGGRDLFNAVQDEHPDLKMIMMTGYPLGGQTRELLDRERVTWLQKPLTAEMLTVAVRKMLEGAQSTRSISRPDSQL